MNAEQLNRLLEVIELDIVPRTRKAVESGNKIFGAAVLRAADLALVVAGTNEEVDSPLWHGEMVALRDLATLPKAERPDAEHCLLLSTHEPCPMCLSAIAWAGIPTIYYLFGYEQTRDTFEIPHDLKLLSQIFGCEEGNYNRANDFWECHAIEDGIEACGDVDRTVLGDSLERIRQTYADLSHAYQSRKKTTGIYRK